MSPATTASREELITKLRARLALSRSSNPHEAANAAAAAERLIQAHRLSEAEVAKARAGESEDSNLSLRLSVSPTGHEVEWLTHLAHFLAGQYNCAAVSTYDHATEYVEVVGSDADLETVRFMYTWISLEILRLAEEAATAPRKSRHLKHKPRSDAWRLDFCVGAVLGIQSAMKKASRAARKEAGPAAARGLVLIQQQANQALAQRYDDVQYTKAEIAARSTVAFEAGEKAARKLAKAPGKQLKGKQP